MTQEDKELLLKDLCARLPYRVKCQMEDDFIINDSPFYDYILSEKHIELFRNHKGFYIKPYLRPMSSMTDKERKDLLVTVVGKDGIKYFQVLSDGSIDNTDAVCQDLEKFIMHWINFDSINTTSYIDWLNAHYFDYRGLIEKGLAIAVTKENNPYKE